MAGYFERFGRYAMAEFKSISIEAVPLALEKAERYRLLNEPRRRRASAGMYSPWTPRTSRRWLCCFLR